MALKPWQRDTWHLTSWISAAALAFFMLGHNDPEMKSLFVFHPGAALQGLQIWRFVTYPFIFGGPISFFFSAFMLMIVGSALEALWGSRQFLTFFLVSVLGGSAMAAIVGVPIYGLEGVYLNMLVAYAVHFPDAVFLIYFVLPVRVKWIAMLGAGFFAFDCLKLGLPGAALLVGSMSGLIFWGLRLRSGRVVRRAATTVRKAAEAVTVRRDVRQEVRQALETVRGLAQRIQAGSSAADQEALESMKRRIEPGVNTCPREHFEPESDFCSSCNGFLECALRAAGLVDLPLRKPGGKTAAGAADALAAYHTRQRELKRQARLSTARPATDSP